MEAWARWRRSSEYEDLLAEERVLGDKLRAGPDGVDADRAHQRCPSADGPQQVLDGPATFVDASTDGGLDGLGQPVQHAGLLSHRVLGSRRAGHTVQSAEADSPEAEALIVRVDGASSQYGFPARPEHVAGAGAPAPGRIYDGHVRLEIALHREHGRRDVGADGCVPAVAHRVRLEGAKALPRKDHRAVVTVAGDIEPEPHLGPLMSVGRHLALHGRQHLIGSEQCLGAWLRVPGHTDVEPQIPERR